MGSISRAARAERFIQQFNEKIIGKLDLKVGTNLEVVSISLGQQEGTEDVAVFALLREFGASGNEYEVQLGGVVWSPESLEVDSVDDTRRLTGLSTDETVCQLKEARLINPNYEE